VTPDVSVHNRVIIELLQFSKAESGGSSGLPEFFSRERSLPVSKVSEYLKIIAVFELRGCPGKLGKPDRRSEY
jgi:hypothetical protein